MELSVAGDIIKEKNNTEISFLHLSKNWLCKFWRTYGFGHTDSAHYG
ncbi:hypothetical protein QFZ20_005027 [Flavobacterium sp. W4I14]|nr:hypothetical protein [Flavobacterium sp. W4I14]